MVILTAPDGILTPRDAVFSSTPESLWVGASPKAAAFVIASAYPETTLAKDVEALDRFVVIGTAAEVVNFQSKVEAVMSFAVTHSDTRLSIWTLPTAVKRVSSDTITLTPLFTTWSLVVKPATASLIMVVIGYAFI